MRLLILPLLAACACAADPVGVWRFGVGTVDGQPARTGTVVLTGQTMVAADAAPMRLVCSEAPGITAILAAGSSGSFLIEGPAEARVLVLQLDKGAVQIDVRDRKPFAGVVVRGAAMQVEVQGTLFVVERTRRDADYAALVRGKLKVGLRPEIAKALGKAGQLELTERQGVGADTASGLGTPTALSARPQVVYGAGARAAISDQGSGLSDQGTAWGIDLGAELTGAGLEGAGGLPGAGPGLAGDGLAGGGPGAIPFAAVAEDLVDSLSELGSPPQTVGDTVVQPAAAGGASGPAGLPPPPPPPGF